MFQPVSKWGTAGVSLALPSGAPPSAHDTIVYTSFCGTPRAFLKAP
jgi:hypothetical protein